MVHHPVKQLGTLRRQHLPTVACIPSQPTHGPELAQGHKNLLVLSSPGFAGLRQSQLLQVSGT